MIVPPPLGHVEGNGIHPALDGGPPSAGCGRRSGPSTPARNGQVRLHQPFQKQLKLNIEKTSALGCDIFGLFLKGGLRGGGLRAEVEGKNTQPGGSATSRWFARPTPPPPPANRGGPPSVSHAGAEAPPTSMCAGLLFASLGAHFNLAPLGMSNGVLPPMNQFKMFFVQASSPTPSMHQKLTEHGKCCMQKQPTSNQNFGWIKDPGFHYENLYKPRIIGATKGVMATYFEHYVSDCKLMSFGWEVYMFVVNGHIFKKTKFFSNRCKNVTNLFMFCWYDQSINLFMNNIF